MVTRLDDMAASLSFAGSTDIDENQRTVENMDCVELCSAYMWVLNSMVLVEHRGLSCLNKAFDDDKQVERAAEPSSVLKYVDYVYDWRKSCTS